jgi:hypothetical protein
MTRRRSPRFAAGDSCSAGTTYSTGHKRGLRSCATLEPSGASEYRIRLPHLPVRAPVPDPGSPTERSRTKSINQTE